jgi:molybdenum cofactor biosynthesis enzyme MoaA
MRALVDAFGRVASDPRISVIDGCNLRCMSMIGG